jgi:hypothetical protein
MPRETPAQRRRRLAVASGVTASSGDFRTMCRKKPHRVGIVAEGDSWFAYPRKWIAFGADINIVHHIADKLRGSNSANLLRLASNGDEAVEMTSGPQFQTLYEILKKNRDHIHLLLFSGGGNDIVGKHDMLPLLKEYSPGMTALDCIDQHRFERKIDAIMLAYHRLVDLCADIVPNATIITHTYDIPMPEDSGAEFFWGLIKTKPWVFPYLERRDIPQALHLPIIDHMLGTFGSRLRDLAGEPDVAPRLKVVDTQGTLRPGHGRDWLNEIHPTEYGFKRVTKKIYSEMRSAQPSLPEW